MLSHPIFYLSLRDIYAITVGDYLTEDIKSSGGITPRSSKSTKANLKAHKEVNVSVRPTNKVCVIKRINKLSIKEFVFIDNKMILS